MREQLIVLGTRIKKIRKERKMTLQALADRTAVENRKFPDDSFASGPGRHRRRFADRPCGAFRRDDRRKKIGMAAGTAGRPQPG